MVAGIVIGASPTGSHVRPSAEQNPLKKLPLRTIFVQTGGAPLPHAAAEAPEATDAVVVAPATARVCQSYPFEAVGVAKRNAFGAPATEPLRIITPAFSDALVGGLAIEASLATR
jgi:hypothetical protein